MRRYLSALFITLALILASIASARSQPACLTTVPNSTACQAEGVNPQINDIVLGQQAVGPTRSNQSVKFTLGTLVGSGFPVVASTITASGNTIIGGSLSVTGVTTFSSPVNIPAGLTTLSSLRVTGNTTLVGTLASGNTTITGTLGVSGATTLSSTLGVTGAITAPSITSTGPTFQIANNGATTSFGGPVSFLSTTIGALPGSGAASLWVWTSDCRNGSEGAGAGTGCFSYRNNAGTWVQLSNPSNLQINVAGQVVALGGTVNGQGNGPRLLTATGTFVPGNAIVTSANGTAIDGGAPPGGGSGGGGTVGNCGSAPALAYYAASGTSVTCLGQLPNAVLVSNGASLPAFATTLPTALTIPTATLTNPVISGTATIAAATFSGTLTTAASTGVGANLICPQGTAPTSPTNGMIWCTTQGLFGRFNGFTQGPYASLTGFSATAPLVYNNGTGNFTCPTCLAGASGGTLTATAPLALSGAAVLTIGNTTSTLTAWWGATVAVSNDTIPVIDT